MLRPSPLEPPLQATNLTKLDLYPAIPLLENLEQNPEPIYTNLTKKLHRYALPVCVIDDSYRSMEIFSKMPSCPDV